MSQSQSLKDKINQLVEYYQTSQKEQESRHMDFMAEAMRILESRNKDLELLREEKRHLETNLALARQELRKAQQEIQDQRDYIQRLQSIPLPSTANAYLFHNGPMTANLQRGCE